jgi:hypothetical protein
MKKKNKRKTRLVGNHHDETLLLCCCFVAEFPWRPDPIVSGLFFLGGETLRK